MRTPTIHLNGTSAEALLDNVQTALRELCSAYKAIEGMAPHPRDYYLQGDCAFDNASDSHSSMLAKIKNVREEVYKVYEGILDQQND